MSTLISHAFVLPDTGFHEWLQSLRPYTQKFDRVAIVRSPRGNDLNRYRHVSAVTAPMMWFQNDPLAHIRRIYPSVVRVDVVVARTPAELSSMLQVRINQNDRFGERQTTPPHIFDRFVMEWPTRHRPLAMRPFNDDDEHPGLEISTRAGAEVLASAEGTVTRQWAGDRPDELRLGQYVQVTSSQGGQTFIITYAGLRQVNVPLNSRVRVGDLIGQAAGDRIRIIVQNPPLGMMGYSLPYVIDPTQLIYVQDLRLRPLDTGLRVRTLPTMEGQVLGQIQPWDFVEPLEMHGHTLRKVGITGQWNKVKMPDGRAGFAASWYLEAIIRGEQKLPFAGVNPVGINLDALHRLGAPDASRLGRMGWVRIPYNVSRRIGSEDLTNAYERYAPLAARYASAGYKVMFVTSHETYGEAKGFPPWHQLSDDDWKRLIDRFSAMFETIARQYAGKGLVHAWQVWNEQDAIIGQAMSSVPMREHNYTDMLRKSIQAIRASDPDVSIITGGHTGGPSRGGRYASTSINALPINLRPDGIAFHPYGRGPNPGIPYAGFGHIDDEISAYEKILPDKPMWITEWGVLDRAGDNPIDIANYAANFISHIKARYPTKIAAMMWYAWAESMHNGYGLVDVNDRPRPPLTDRYLNA